LKTSVLGAFDAASCCGSSAFATGGALGESVGLAEATLLPCKSSTKFDRGPAGLLNDCNLGVGPSVGTCTAAAVSGALFLIWFAGGIEFPILPVKAAAFDVSLDGAGPGIFAASVPCPAPVALLVLDGPVAGGGEFCGAPWDTLVGPADEAWIAGGAGRGLLPVWVTAGPGDALCESLSCRDAGAGTALNHWTPATRQTTSLSHCRRRPRRCAIGLAVPGLQFPRPDLACCPAKRKAPPAT